VPTELGIVFLQLRTLVGAKMFPVLVFSFLVESFGFRYVWCVS
jgi:hypothetical protein